MKRALCCSVLIGVVAATATFGADGVNVAVTDVAKTSEAGAAQPILDAYKASKYKEALELAKLELKAHPESSQALLAAGMSAYRLEQLEAARGYFAKLVALKEESLIAQNNLGVIQFELKKNAEALTNFTNALRVAPDNGLAINNAAEALAKSEKLKTTAGYVALDRVYQQAQARQQKEKSKQGLVRQGDGWTSLDQLSADATAKKNAEDKLSAAKRFLSEVETAIGPNAPVVTAKEKEDYAIACPDPVLEKAVKSAGVKAVVRDHAAGSRLLELAREDVAKAKEDCDRYQQASTRSMRIMEWTEAEVH